MRDQVAYVTQSIYGEPQFYCAQLYVFHTCIHEEPVYNYNNTSRVARPCTGEKAATASAYGSLQYGQ